MGAATLSSPTPVQASRTVQTFRPLTTLPVQTLPTVSSSAERSRASDNDGAGDRVVSTVTYAAPVSGLEPGMWSGHRPGTTDRYRRWTYASWYEDEPQDVGGVRLSGLSRRKHPQLPVALRFRYVGAPLWWSHPAPRVVTADASAEPTRAMQAGLRAANSAAAIWRSILVAAAPVDDVTGGMDAGRERSAEKMSSLGRSLDALSTPLVSGTPPPAAATPTAPAYIAMSSAGAAGAVSSAMAARARAQAVEMSIVAAIPPAPPPLETMRTAARGAEAPHARGRGHAHEAAHGHPKEGDDAVSHSKIEGSVDAIAQRIYHRIRRRIESDRERFGG